MRGFGFFIGTFLGRIIGHCMWFLILQRLVKKKEGEDDSLLNHCGVRKRSTEILRYRLESVGELMWTVKVCWRLWNDVQEPLNPGVFLPLGISRKE